MSRIYSDHLFKLIKALTSDEKRYFKKHIIRGEEVPNYELLFDLIEKQEVYDETRILKKIPTLKPAQISNQKNYLYRMILESLRRMRSQDDMEFRINNMIKEADLLFDKRLTDQCGELLQRARKLAEKYDKQRLLFSILAMEETLQSETARGEDFEQKLEKIFNEGNGIVDSEKRLQELRFLLNRVSRYFRFSGLLRDKAEIDKLHLLMQHPALNPSQPYHHFTEKYFYQNIHGMYHMLLRDWPRTFIHRKAIVKMFNAEPHMKNEMKKSYVSALNNYILACEFTKNFSQLEQTFFSVRELFHDPSNKHNLHLLVRIMGGYSSMLHTCIAFGEFENGLKIFREIEQVFEKLKEQINKASAISFYYTFAYIHFGCADYRKSLAWLNRILNAKEMDVREDILIFSKLLNLVIHYELGNEASLEHFVRSTYRYLLKKRTHFKLEKIVIDFIGKKMPRVSSKKEEMTALMKLREEVKELSRDPVEKRAFEYFDFLSWLNGKISGRSFAEEVKRSATSAK